VKDVKENRQRKRVQWNCEKTTAELEEEEKERKERMKKEMEEMGRRESEKSLEIPSKESSSLFPPVIPRRRSSSSAQGQELPKTKATPVADLVDPTIKGFLYVYYTSGLKSWHKRFCVLKDSVLYIYKKEQDKDAQKKIILPSYSVSPSAAKDGKQWVCKVKNKFIFVIDF